MAAPVSAALIPASTPCSVNDLVPSAQACVGFYQGNLTADGGPQVQDQKDALALLGFTWGGVQLEKLENLNGNQLINFSTLLTGTSYVSIHYGNGQGGPGNATAFYKLNAGAGLDTFRTVFNASSSAVLYAVGSNAVPEPATWAMMIGGFGAIGASLRRSRRTKVSFV